MKFLQKLFGKSRRTADPRGDQDPANVSSDATELELITLYDEYGRSFQVTKQQWKEDFLIQNIEQRRGSPDELYSILLGALNDGFAADIVPYAEELARHDLSQPSLVVLLAVVYMECDRWDDAEQLLDSYLATHGEDDYVLVNLGKIYAHYGDTSKAVATFWHALEVNPNQEEAVSCYAVQYAQDGSEAGMLDAYRRIAELPGSWKSRLWIARHALQQHDLDAALQLYRESLERAEPPLSPDLLMQISGDLGNHGYLEESLRIVEPHFDVATHGLAVGNNIIKAYHDLHQPESARRVLSQLFAQARPDWHDTLGFWETELDKLEFRLRQHDHGEPASIAMLVIDEPLWNYRVHFFDSLLPEKAYDAPRIMFFGSTVLQSDTPQHSDSQLSDGRGRLSRVIPLFLAEFLHLSTISRATAAIPWAQEKGFAVFGQRYSDSDLCVLAGNSGDSPDWVGGLTVDATTNPWRILLRIVRVDDATCVAEESFPVDASDPGPAVLQLGKVAQELLLRHAPVMELSPPDWYRIPEGSDSTDYLLRQEQQLAVVCQDSEGLSGGGLTGEHEILDGAIGLCLQHPQNPLVRMILARTFHSFVQLRPEYRAEYRSRIQSLQRRHPLAGHAADCVQSMLDAALAEDD